MAKVDISGMTKEEIMAKAEEIAKGYFREGLNCSECVLRTFMDMHDIDLPDAAITLCTGFGGGMGHTQNNCGAVSGAVMAFGAVKGRRDPFAKEDMGARISELQEEIYPVFGKMVNEIKEHEKTLICKELCDPFGDFNSVDRKRNCKRLIAYCAAVAAKYAEEYKK